MGPSMELRDYFAGQAVVPLLAIYERPDFSYTVTKKEAAHRAYEMADAMIEIRASKTEELAATDSQQLKQAISFIRKAAIKCEYTDDGSLVRSLGALQKQACV